jgi:hypothetical protein
MPSLSQYAKAPDSEKLTLNLGFVDLGSIDLLVRDGFYSNRSDFIRTAIPQPARDPCRHRKKGGFAAHA